MRPSLFRLISLVFGALAACSFLACQFDSSHSPKASAGAKKQVGIIGGEETSAQAYPYIVNLWLDSPKDLFVGHLCGASLVHSKWVLTAAHCVLLEATNPQAGTIKLSELTLFVGSNHVSGRGGQALKAKSIHVHPNYEFPNFDVALIELKDEVSNINPVIMNKKPIADEDFANLAVATALGWGLMDELGRVEADLLQKIDLPLVSREVCRTDAYVKHKSWEIGPHLICAKTELGQRATCEGDSGGPLIQKQNGKDVQIGVVSWGSACRQAFQGRQADVEGYSDVSAAFPWIQEIMKGR